MLTKFSNHPPGNDSPAARRRQTLHQILVATGILLLLTATGMALYIWREPLKSASTHLISGSFSLEKLTSGQDDGTSIIQPLLSILPGSEKLAPATAKEKSTPPESILYTVELKDGGRIEGQTIKIEKESIRVIDDKGIEILVPREKVLRLTKLHLDE